MIKKQITIGSFEAAYGCECQLIRCLGFADAEHLGAAFGADTLGCRFAILHLNGLGVLHFPLGSAFHAISVHQCTSYVI